MMKVGVNLGPLQTIKGAFIPKRRAGLIYCGSNPRAWTGRGGLAGLVIVGLEDQAGRRHTLDEIIQHVRTAREEQSNDPGASFMLQRGLYRDQESGRVYDEESVRIIILHLTSETAEQFKEHIEQLGESLRLAFNQNQVIVEFQRRGLTIEVFGLEAEK